MCIFVHVNVGLYWTMLLWIYVCTNVGALVCTCTCDYVNGISACTWVYVPVGDVNMFARVCARASEREIEEDRETDRKKEREGNLVCV